MLHFFVINNSEEYHEIKKNKQLMKRNGYNCLLCGKITLAVDDRQEIFCWGSDGLETKLAVESFVSQS